MHYAALCDDVMLDSRVQVERGERTLLLGYVLEPGHHGGLQGVQSVMVAPADDLFPSMMAGCVNMNPSGSPKCCGSTVDGTLQQPPELGDWDPQQVPS